VTLKTEASALFYKIMEGNQELSTWLTTMRPSAQKLVMEVFLLGYVAGRNPDADFRERK